MYYLQDYDHRGIIDSSTGTIIEVTDVEAVNNALILFLQLQTGETIENELLESPIYKAISKPLSDYYAETIADLLFLAVDNYFIPKLNITELFVFPNIEEDQWDITLSAEVSSLEIETNVSLSISNSMT